MLPTRTPDPRPPPLVPAPQLEAVEAAPERSFGAASSMGPQASGGRLGSDGRSGGGAGAGGGGVPAGDGAAGQGAGAAGAAGATAKSAGAGGPRSGWASLNAPARKNPYADLEFPVAPVKMMTLSKTFKVGGAAGSGGGGAPGVEWGWGSH